MSDRYQHKKDKRSGGSSGFQSNRDEETQHKRKRPFSPQQNSGGNAWDEKAAKIMRLMGYREGKGLGKEQQGIVDPIQVQERKGHKGLGYEARKTFEEPIPLQLDWNTEESINIEEKIEWIPQLDNRDFTIPDKETLSSWLKIGKKKLVIDDETEFVDPEILKWILRCKTALDEFSENELFKARSRSNPYETIRKGIFINRAAMKMANIDAVMNFEITNPKTITGETAVAEQELLYFADICAGPGGFSEYVLWRKSWNAKGFGFTLKGDCDFKLHDFISGPPESFEPHYGVEGNGDIYNPANCRAFIDYVIDHTDGNGVHFVMADGGFSVKGQENIQEILSRQLYLSQAMVALGIIRKEGHFICKLFDVFTPFSVGLVYLMRFCFEEVALLKPNTSRPANSERYLICKWRKENITLVYEYLKEAHQQMWSWSDENIDILEIVPLELLKDEEDPFFDYIREGNNENGIRQIQNLRKIVEFWNDGSLREDRQHDTRLECLQFWDIPFQGIRKRDMPVEPYDKFVDLLQKTYATNSNFEKTIDRDLSPTLRATEFRSPYNWRFCMVENGKFKKNRGFFLSTGRSRIFKSDGYNRWEPLDSYVKFQMSNDTLVYGEIVTEYEGSMPNQRKTTTFHIIDALILGGKDVRGLSLVERNQWSAKFAKAMNKTYAVSGFGSLRAKELIPMEDFRILHSKKVSEYRLIAGGGKTERLLAPVISNQVVYKEELGPFIQPGGVIFLQEIIDPWLVAISRTHERKYYFDRRKGHKTFDTPPNAIAEFIVSMKNRIFWEWDKDIDLNYPRELDDNNIRNKVHAQEIIDYVEKIKKDGVK